MNLGFLVACPLADLPLNATGHILHFAFNPILVHNYCSSLILICDQQLYSNNSLATRTG
jgi:hypothetical protein